MSSRLTLPDGLGVVRLGISPKSYQRLTTIHRDSGTALPMLSMPNVQDGAINIINVKTFIFLCKTFESQ